MTLRTLVLGAFAAALAGPGTPNTEQDRSAIRGILIAEDSRPGDSVGIQPLRVALRSSDVRLQARAARAFGRLEQPAFITEVAPLLSSPDATVRAEAAQALAQMVMSARLQAAARATEAARVYGLLRDAAARERNPRALSAIVRSLTRIPLAGTDQIQGVESVALSLLANKSDSATLVSGLLSLERLLRLNNRTSPASRQAVDSLRAIATRRSIPAPARLYSLMALSAASGGIDGSVLAQTLTDPDAQVRRVSAVAASSMQGIMQRDQLLRAFIRDSAQIVRLEAVRGWLRLGSMDDCKPLVAAISDPAVNVALAAIDALAQAADRCPAAQRGDIESTLAVLVLAGVRSEPGMTAGPGMTADNRITLHKASHALVTTARISPQVARAPMIALTTHSSWIVRMYSARVAAVLRDTTVLLRLAMDAHGNVRSEAITGLSSFARRSGTQAYLAGLAHSDYNVVRVSAGALTGAERKSEVATALFTSLARITREGKETSRDARVALLTRIGELAAPSDSGMLQTYLRDVDAAVASRAAQILSGWLNRTVQPSPASRPASAAPDDVPAGTRLRFIMSPTSGGGIFEVVLNSDIAPYTAARIVRLARAGYYDGLTFHRIAPNFVVQGGSPGANEYVGDGPFMRDEIWLDTHARGTLGISTRGRDTGDAQIFINTVDNPRLDFDYTVFARVTYGMPLVDAILEGDVIQHVSVLPP